MIWYNEAVNVSGEMQHLLEIAIRHQLSTNIWERGHPACPNASETLTFLVHAQLSQDC
jgi:hypothetical protein